MIEVDYRADETFLFAYITDISSFGIFVRTAQPEVPGTQLSLRFTPPRGGLGAAAPSDTAYAADTGYAPPRREALDEADSRDGDPGGLDEPIECEGEVIWINPPPEQYADLPGAGELKPCHNPGMGIRFRNLSEATRRRLLELVRTFAYLDEERPEN